jgi:FtsP/CotA-like multicopper oxidase with cupredoxin domain
VVARARHDNDGASRCRHPRGGSTDRRGGPPPAPPATAGIAAAEADLAAIHDLPNPPEIRSQHGVLSGTLTNAPAQVTVAGRRTTSNVINGDFVPPTLRVRRGDMIEVRAVNRIGKAAENIDGPQPTNIHYHGMDVSPIPPGDSVFVRIRPERRFGYQVYVPTDHPQGLHWYHAYVHHFVDDQIGSGVSGMLIVDGFIERQYPELGGLRERVMVLKDFTFPGFKDGDARTKSLNGYADPPIRARPGEFQIWEIGNLGADAFFDIRRRLREGPADPGSIKPNPADLLKAKIARTRHMDFSASANGDTFFINGRTYDENRVDSVVQLGDVER